VNNYQAKQMIITREGQNTTKHIDVCTLSNRDMAAILFNIATVLKQNGNTNPYRTAAYERGARALMGLRREVKDVLSSEERVPFRRRQHIGVKLHSKIREMAATGELDQYQNMLGELPPHQQELMTIPGIGPKLADVLFAEIGVATAADLVRTARDGRLKQVPGFGRRRVAQIATIPLPEDAESPGQLSLFD
jgi:DNA polymerase (family 10)